MTDPLANYLSTQFQNSVRRVIILMTNAPGSLENEDILKILTENKINHDDAVEIVIFLPIAFVRQLFPMCNWPDTYLEYIDETTTIEKNIVNLSVIK